MPPNVSNCWGLPPGKDGEDGGVRLEIDWKRKDGTPLKVRLSGRQASTEGEKDSYEIIVEDIPSSANWKIICGSRQPKIR